MHLPTPITDLIYAQNGADAQAYTACFAPTATVIDENKTYVGKPEILQWITKANATFKTKMKPIAYSEKESILKAEISGDFPGSPLVLTYTFRLENNLIQFLEIV